MTEQLTRWDSAEYLKTEEDMANYLDACMEEAGDDPAFIAKPWEPSTSSRNWPVMPGCPGKIFTAPCRGKEILSSALF